MNESNPTGLNPTGEISTNIDFAQAINIAGQSPLYLYRRSKILNRVKLTQAAFPKEISLHYSLKANPHPQLVSLIANHVNGLDVSSHSELLLALATELPSSCISYSGPGKTDRELKAAIAANVSVHVESMGELHRLLSLSSESGYEPRVALRINPPFLVKRSGMKMGGGAQQFGIDLENIGPILKCLSDNNVSCSGLHCYAASQMLDESIIADVHAQTIDMMIKLIDTYRLSDVSLNIGGGLGVPYFSNEKAINIESVGNSLNEKISSTDYKGKIIIELGRYLLAEAGTYIAKVVERKVSRGTTFLILDGGLNHHLAATGNLGQVIRRNFPITTSSTKRNTEVVSIVGPLCTPLDILGNDIELPETDVGDFIAVHQSGAYGYSASPQNFLGHTNAAEVIID